MPLRLLFHFLAIGLLAIAQVASAKAGEIIEGDPGDAMVSQTAINDSSYATTYDLYVGALYTGNATMVEAFQLPYLAPGQQVTGATLSFYLEQSNSTPTNNVQLYGLNRVSATNPAPLLSDWYLGASDSNNTLLNAKFVTPASPLNQICSYSGANLVSFVQKQYTNSAFSGLDLSGSRYIFFRLSPDATQNGFNNYLFASSRHSNRAYHPTLALTISNGISNIAGRLQFSFNLPVASTTSAGVYNTSTGALLRTLWNNVQYQSGTNYGVWDGNDDSGKPLATGSNYQIKLIYHNVQYVWEGTIGNTSANQSGTQVYRSYGKMHDMAISGGSAFYTVGYNESGNPYNTFTVGSPQMPSGVQFGYNFTDPFSSIYFVASDASRSYWAKTYGGISGSNTYVIAVNNGSTSSFYTFPKGTVPTGTNQKYTSCVDFDATANQPNPATGLAVQQSGSYLFVSHGSLNLVRVFDKVQGNLVGSFTVQKPGRVATTADGDVWVISGTTSPSVLRYTFANGTATLKQTITGFVSPAGLSVSADDSLLLVADGGSSEQIKAYLNATGAPAWTYGMAGGMAANGPNITTNTFNFNTQTANYNSFSNEAFIAFQPDNTFWVEDGGNGRILHFSISGNTPVYIEQIAYMDVSYQSTVDLTDATRVFNTFTEYSVNYSLPPGGTNGSWTMVKNWSAGLPNDSTHYYFGFANGLNNVVTLSNGHTYGFMTNMITGNYDLFELPASGPARLTGYSFNDKPRMYEDGTLRFNMANSTNTSLSFYSQPLTGFDSENNPLWGSPALLASTALSSTDPKPWGAFPPRTEITAGGSVVNFGPNQADTGYHLAGLSLGGTAWQWHACPSTTSAYLGWFPQDGRFDVGNGVQYAGNYAMALGRNIVYGYHGEFWKAGEASQWVNFLDNGLMVGRFGTYESLSLIGNNAINGFAGNSFAPTLVQGPNGSTYLYHNDESNHGGTCRWRIDGWNAITELNATSTIGSTASLSSNSVGPTVTITSPTAGAAYLNSHNLTLSASAASSGASVTAVQFFDGATSLGTVTTAPFNLSYSGLSTGAHVLTAKATDSNGLSATSAAVNMTIGGDGSSSQPPTPISLTTGTIGSQSVALSWTEPAVSTTSSTIGQIISFQCDVPGDGNALAPTEIAGAPSYAAAHFNIFGQTASPSGPTLISPTNSAGTIIPNLGVYTGIASSNSTNSTQSLSGTTKKLFSAEISTYMPQAVSISNIPYARYDLVVYSLGSDISAGPQTASLSLTDGVLSSTVQQSFTTVPTDYAVSSVAFGSSSSVSDSNVVVFQGLTSPFFQLQGGNIAGFQIVEKPYDQGTPTAYNIERSPGTTGTFTVVGTAAGTASSFTDSNGLASGTAYQYRISATNSFGTSAYSNMVSVTTSGSATGTPATPTPPAPPTPTPTPAANFLSWQSQYFTASQLADATISGANANPYGSGVPNLLAYALQLNPATAQLTDVPTPVPSNGHLNLTYVVPASVADVTYTVQVSTDLVTWNSGTNYTQILSNVTGPTGNTITVQDTLPSTAPKRFMRLNVTQNP